MLTKHVFHLLEPYLDRQLSDEERRQVEDHLYICPMCARRFFDTQRLNKEVGPVMKTVLGQPTPPPALRHRVRHALEEAEPGSPRGFGWTLSGQILNTAGTMAIIALLAFAVFAVVQGQIPGAQVSSKNGSLQGTDSLQENIESAPQPTLTPQLERTVILTLTFSSLEETLPKDLFSRQSDRDTMAAGEPPSTISEPLTKAQSQPDGQTPAQLSQRDSVTGVGNQPKLPGGTIAFSFFNPAAYRQVYEIHLISPDGKDHSIFSLDGVSEPALRQTADGYELAYRAWSEPTSPRALLTSDLEGFRPNVVGHFWEDAQPDWSPTENRLIFASQRESDRHWRLYTSWGDGSTEVNLRREGKSPTFAPDGYRFAFESCDPTGNQCGLWIADLDNSEFGARPFLEDPQAKSPDWSPVGEQIAYMSNQDNNWDLYLVNSDGSGRRRLTDAAAIDGLPVWSPDGKWLAFLSDRGGKWGIWLLHVASGEVQQVFKFDGGTLDPPARDPYGERSWLDEQLSWSR